MKIVTRTYLEMRSPKELVRRRLSDPAIAVHQVRHCHPQFWRRLYQGVGEAYGWTDRLEWTDEEIEAYLADVDTSLYVLTDGGEVAGYYELRQEPDGSIEIAYLGLLSEHIGRGLGAHLLTDAVEEAWRRQPSRVWLHTCTLDHPAALPNYERAGFTIFKVEAITPPRLRPIIS